MVLRNLLHHDRPIVLDRAEVWLVSGPFIRRSRGDVVGKIVAVPRVHHLGLVSRRAVVLERPLLLVHRIEDDLSLGLHSSAWGGTLWRRGCPCRTGALFSLFQRFLPTPLTWPRARRLPVMASDCGQELGTLHRDQRLHCHYN